MSSFAEICLATVTLIVYVVIIGFVVYIFYMSFYSQYYKIVYDLITMSMFRKQNVDQIMSENTFLVNHFKYLLRTDSQYAGANPVRMFAKLSNIPCAIDAKVNYIESLINLYYANNKGVRRYVEAFKEYFMFKPLMESPVSKIVYLYPQKLFNPNEPVKQCPSFASGMTGPNQKPLQKDKMDCPAPAFKIESYNFYERLLEFYKTDGKDSSMLTGTKVPTDKSGEQFTVSDMIARLYIIDQFSTQNEAFLNLHPALRKYAPQYQNAVPNLLRVQRLINGIESLEAELVEIMTYYNQTKVHHYLVIPEEDQVKKLFTTLFDTYKNNLELLYGDTINRYFNQIETVKKKSQGSESTDFAWYIFEMLHVIATRKDYNTLMNEIEVLMTVASGQDSLPRGKPTNNTIDDFGFNSIQADNPQFNEPKPGIEDGRFVLFDAQYQNTTVSIGLYEMKLFLTTYVNLSKKDRDKVERHLLRNRPYSRMSKNKPALSKVIDFLTKHPIFAHLYLTNEYTEEQKQVFYGQILSTYHTLFFTQKDVVSQYTAADKADVLYDNYVNNVKCYKDFQNAVSILHLYLHRYKAEIMQLYSEQYASNNNFFWSLFSPFLDELFVRNIGQVTSRTFTKSQFRKSYNAWLKIWRKFGSMITKIRQDVVDSFSRSLSMAEEDKPATDSSEASI